MDVVDEILGSAPKDADRRALNRALAGMAWNAFLIVAAALFGFPVLLILALLYLLG